MRVKSKAVARKSSPVLIENVIIPACVRGFSLDAGRFDIDVQNRVVAQITRAQAAPESIASGTLLPCLVDAHVHIDKTYVVDEVGAADGDLFKAIQLMGQHRARWTGADIQARMQRAVQEAYMHGTRAMRTHLDWVEAATPQSLAVFETLRHDWRDQLTLQCVSLTPLDAFDSADFGLRIAQELRRINTQSHSNTALLGAFVYRNADMHTKLQRMFDLAKAHDLQLDFHVDEGLDADACGLRAIAELTIANHYQGKVTCGHACSLSVQPLAEAKATLKLCAEAGIFLVSLPSTNLYLQGAWDTTPVERGVTRLKEAVAEKIRACIATDNVADGFYPYGSYDLLDTYALGVQAAHLSPADAWLTTITTAPAAAMGLPWDGKIKAGCPADFVLLAARTPYELVTPAGRQRRVMRAGQFLTD
jgi:cytosine/creatinine deaminase